MPIFRKRLRVYNAAASRSEEVDAVVDSGSIFCQVPQDMADRLELAPFATRRLRMADGRVVELGLANAMVELPEQGEVAATTMVIAQVGAAAILGTMALDSFGLGVDTAEQRLIPKVLELLTQTNWPTI